MPRQWIRRNETPDEKKARRNAERRAKYARDEAYREGVKDRARIWQAENPERVRANGKKWADAVKRGEKVVNMSPASIANARENTRQWRKEHKEVVRAYLDARRAALKAARPGKERVLWREVRERSNGVCGYCGEPIDMTLEYPDLMSMSYDHIVPISQGGLHTTENIQCVHLRCNIKKRDKCDGA